MREPEVRRYLAENADFEDEIKSYREAVEIGEGPGEFKARVPMFHHLEGGHEVPTFLLANIRGLCLETSFPSANGYDPHRKLISSLEKVARARSQRPGPEVRAFERRFREPMADIFNTGWLRHMTKTCRRVKSPVPLIPVSYSMADSLNDFEEKLNTGKIGPRERRRYLGALNFALERHRLVAVGYNLNAFVDPEADKVKFRSAQEVEADGDHSSTVVARRRFGGRCHYLIRDTSGYDCPDYLPAIRARCRDHHFWLTEEEIGAHFYDMVYLR